MGERWRGGLPVAVLGAVTIAVFWEAIFTGKTFFSRDLFHLYYPIKLFIRDSILAGRLPLWNPHVYCGVPFLGDFISSLFYPLNVIFLLLPMGLAFKVFIICHYLLASIFGYLFQRSRGGSREAGLLVGIAFGFSGYLLSMHNNIIYLQTGIWTPLLLLLALRARRGWGWAAGAALVLGIQILGGDLQGAILSAILSVLGCLVLPVQGSPTGTVPLRRTMQAAGAILLGGIGVAAIQWIPSAVWAAASPRGAGLSYETATEWSLHPLQLLEMAAPGIYGNRFAHDFWGEFLVNSRFGTPWAYALTVGIVPLFLAPWTVLSRKAGKETVFWALIGLTALLFAFGSHLHLYRLLHSLPGFDVFRYPAKLFYFSSLSLAVLSGIALDRLRTDRSARVVALRDAFLGGTTLMLVAFAILLLFRAGTLEFFRGMTRDISGVDPIGAMGSMALGLLRSSFVLGILTILLHLRVKGGIKDGPFTLALVAAAALELAVLHGRTRITAPGDLHAHVPRTVQAVRSIGMDGYRFAREGGNLFPYPEREYRFRYGESPERKQRFFADSLQSNLGMRYGLDDALGYSPAEPIRLLQFFDALRDLHLRKYSLLGVKAFVAVTGLQSREVPLDHLRLVAPRQGGRFAVLENPAALPRALLLSRAREVPSGDAALMALRAPGFDPGAEVILEGGEGEIDLGPGQRQVEVVERNPGDVVLEVRAEAESFLLWNESWSPGWTARVDGKPREVRVANFLMQAVKVPAGSHRVTLRYRPRSVLWGGLITIVTLAALALAVVRGRRK